MAGGGGAWKVAYADFVTAMMAFFLVMWLVSQDQKIKQNVSDYFLDPFGERSRPPIIDHRIAALVSSLPPHAGGRHVAENIVAVSGNPHAPLWILLRKAQGVVDDDLATERDERQAVGKLPHLYRIRLRRRQAAVAGDGCLHEGGVSLEVHILDIELLPPPLTRLGVDERQIDRAERSSQ